ncbi:Dyp-type peroxidase [Segniliparus rugosus]|uniref:Tat-translocated enzyme n=1 Tax=Segniliparus rugosus (strain ATCC BAA-974 / DSM 45345 / CCUG 50838 / CIP 108380 / JCM 13579 / CDC 945) TaxID=679197 RepID=E5XP33_SEGRC|nr:Dyp-type peroxidase [Segniliparus rugosus]EFV13879.2 tat-translocated enzyme [Segniliparus rugosus ATCC BAA-974]
MTDSGAGAEASLGRRALLLGGAVAAAGALASCGPDRPEPPGAAKPAPLYGEHQPGVLAEPAPAAVVASANVLAAGRGELAELFKTITERIRTLASGKAPMSTGIGDVPADSGTLGPTPEPSGLTVTLGVGASLFDGRYGLAGRKPARLARMEAFEGDELDPAWCHGDLSLVVAAQSQDATLRALRDIARHTRGAMQLNWKIDGATAPPRPDGAPRNHFGFKDGTANPDPANAGEMDRLVWAAPDDQAWTKGGSYQVVRLIRMLVEFWDRISIGEQEQIFGRDRASGAPLTGNAETDDPDYASDPAGKVIPLTSHIRLANPRDPETDDSRILRRAYNYSRGLDSNGNLDLGLVFTCYQQDVERQFAAVQRRLVGEPLADYIRNFGGGYFFALPGARDERDWLGRGLLA